MEQAVSNPYRRSLALVSLYIAFMIIAQGITATRILCLPSAVASLPSFAFACPPNLYPFMDYPMYRMLHQEGDEIPQIEISAFLEDGQQVVIDPELGDYTIYQG
ncbi:MAG: hypothetical protein H0T73_11110, partial [Ardenticatenales bacterium]|nr:hypothetical protein [Ardenticatenales bacterium]